MEEIKYNPEIHYLEGWHDFWFWLAMRREVQAARTWVTLLIDQYPQEPAPRFFEQQARAFLMQTVPLSPLILLTLADLQPKLWLMADRLNWEPGTEVFALMRAVGTLLYDQVKDLVLVAEYEKGYPEDEP